MSKVVRLFSLISLISQLLFSDFAFFSYKFSNWWYNTFNFKNMGCLRAATAKKKNASERKQKKANPFISNKTNHSSISHSKSLQMKLVFLMSEVSHTKKKKRQNEQIRIYVE